MLLHGSCHCQKVTFSVQSSHPYPYNICYCSICRKTAGSAGYAINISASFDSLEISGKEHIRTYNALLDKSGDNISPAERSFCGNCGSALWVWDPRWPELLHPQAGAIDTELPAPPQYTHLMLGSKPRWIKPNIEPNDKTFDQYPDESISQWHERLGLGK